MASSNDAVSPANPIDPGSPTITPPPQPYLIDSSRPCKEFQYAAKLVLGVPGPGKFDPGHDIVAPGRYYTAINIHNPATCKTVTFRWKVALGTDGRTGPITRFQSLQLRPDEAIEIDAGSVVQALHGLLKATQFLKGFVVIESPCPLDVVAVYSVGAPPAGNTAGNVVAFHTERVPERKIDACRDLKLDLSTGVTDWDLIGGPSISTPRPASVVDPQNQPPGWHNQPGAQWIGANNSSQASAAAGVYTFQTCFTLCSGFDNPVLQLSVLVDDATDLWLNTQHLGSANGQNPTVFSPTGLSLHPGLNTLSFQVTNGGNTPSPMGLNVQATFTADRGDCPDCGGCCSDCGDKKAYPVVNP
jgi:hypothetical protein